MKLQGCVLLLATILLMSDVVAVGVSPPRILLEDIPKGYVLEKSVVLSGIAPGSTVTTSFSGEGSGWIEPKLGTAFVVRDDQDIIFPFVISVPEDAPNGEYEVSAQMVVSGDEKNTGPNSATALSGLLVTMKFTVSGKEINNYKITGVHIPDLEIGNPVFVVMNVRNDGNILAKPSRVEITVKDKKKDIITSDLVDRTTPVEAYSIGESVAVFDLDLEPAFYFADVSVHTDEGVEEVNDVPFDVFEEGAFKAEGELTELIVEGSVEKIAKIDAVFSNQGDINLYPTLQGEVYRDGSLVDVFESEPAYVKKKDSKTFTYYYQIQGGKEYVVKAHFAFLGKQTNTKEVTFSTSGFSLELHHYLIASLIFVVILASTIIFILLKRKR